MAERVKAISRRKLLSSFFYTVGQGAVESVALAEAVDKPRKDGPPHRALLPPGSATEELFFSLCDGCGDCAKACPFDCIKISKNGHPKAYVEPAKSPCRLCHDLPCIAACTKGAMAAPDSASALRLGVAVIDEEMCTARDGADCRLCSIKCPLEPKAIYFKDIGPVLDRSTCTGCGICAEACRTVNDIEAIKIIRK